MDESDSLQEDAIPSLLQSQGASQLQPDLDPCPTSEANDELKCDVGLVFAEEDEGLANDIMDEMQTVEIARAPIVVRLFNDVIFGADIEERPQVVCEHCKIIFIVHTENTTKDLITNFTKNEVIAKIRTEKGGDNIRSLRTEKGLQSLSGLASMQPLDWYKPSKLKKLADIIEHERKKLKDTSISSKMTGLNLQPRVNKTEEDCYTMTADPRGLCVIINNWDFINQKKNRLSAKDHGVKLKELFEKLQFKVHLHENQTKEKIEMIFNQTAEVSHMKYDCFISYIMSHGFNDVVLSKDGKKVRISSLARRFRPQNCDSLRDKPKLFFVDACRNRDDVPDNPFSDDEEEEKKNVDTNEIKDFFFGYSTQPESTAYKNPETGPIYTDEFIKAMEKALTEKKDLNSIMIDVTREVQARKIYFGNEECRALPDTDSKLTKKLYFV